MKRIICILIACLICMVCLGGCKEKADPSLLEKTKEVEAGMTYDEVVSLLGEPNADIGYGAIIYEWIIDDDTTFKVFFKKDIETEVLIANRTWYNDQAEG